VAFKNERIEAADDRYGFALVGVGKQLHVNGFMLSDLLILAVHDFDCDGTPWVRLLILCWSGWRGWKKCRFDVRYWLRPSLKKRRIGDGKGQPTDTAEGLTIRCFPS
jgi:hypothetical protein